MLWTLWTYFSETLGIFTILFTTVISFLVYHCVWKTWNHFTDRNIKFIRGLPFFGSQYRTIFGQRSMFDTFLNFYEKYPNEKFFGIYDIGGTPKYFIRDPELIKQIAIKDFDHFVNHGVKIHEDADPIFGRSLFTMRDQRWKDMRSVLSPSFTGSKMRTMFGVIAEVAHTYFEYLRSCDEIDYEAKDLCTRFANDAIASSAFGITINSMKDRDNEFYKSGQKFANFSLITLLKFFAYISVPKIMNFFRFSILDPGATAFFTKIILDNISYREKNNIVRNDMVNILVETKKEMIAAKNDGTSPIAKWTDNDLVAQSATFFLAGFGTVSLTIAFAMHELAVNPDIEAKLYKEIAEVEETLNGQLLTYDVLQKMKYLDAVMNETLRRWPQAPANDRQVTKPYTLVNSDGTKVQLNVGDNIWLPVNGIHLDPKYYPNPLKFDPERFSEENKDNLVPDTYLPFGIGPRMCIASRFALMECKSFLYYLVSNFKVERSPKTQEPIKLKVNAGVEAANGFWVRLRKRNQL